VESTWYVLDHDIQLMLINLLIVTHADRMETC